MRALLSSPPQFRVPGATGPCPDCSPPPPHRRVLCTAFLAATLALPGAATGAGDCASTPADEYAEVTHVYDGDTVRLADGRRVRLLGIDAPETGRDGAPDEPLAQAAGERLRQITTGNVKIGLRFELERSDRYGRHLAHLLLKDGSNVQRTLLAEGLAAALPVPPNIEFADCYAAIERDARDNRRGIWRSGHMGPLPAHTITAAERGFRLVSGTVARITRSRTAYWLELAPAFSARIPRELAATTPAMNPEHLLGRAIIVRGYLAGDGKRRHLTVRHASALELQPR